MKSFKFSLIIFSFFFVSFTSAQKPIYKNGWIDFNKNGTKDIYEDPDQPVDKRVANLLSQMNLNEKTNQLATLYGYGRVLKDELPTPQWKNMIWKDGIANIDEHLNSTTFRPKTFTKYSYPYSRHAEAINLVQKWFVEETRLGIPVDFSNEGIHGLANEKATGFPAPIAIGSTWNKNILLQSGHILGREAKALGYTNVYVPILDLARDPRWGRVVECYGEDPFLVAELGKQVVLGIQSEGVAATLKHYVAYGSPKGGRDGNARTDPHIAPRELHNMYLYPFERVIKEARPLGVMSSYNDWDGMPITGSYYFLTQLLRQEYGFDGYVVSDSDALEYLFSKHNVAKDSADATRIGLEAGMNVRTNFQTPETFILKVRQQVANKMLAMETIDQRVSEVLNVKFRLGLFNEPYVKDVKRADTVVYNDDAKNFSKQISREVLVLLKNENNTLPLDKKKLKNVLVTGPLADDVHTSMSRYGPSNIKVISVLEGIRNYLKNDVEVTYFKGCEAQDSTWPESEIFPQKISAYEQSRIDSAVQAAKQSDVVIAVVGETENQFGESRSRTSLELAGFQQHLLEALYKTAKPVICVLVNGQPLTINWADKYLPAIIEAWCPGPNGGTAVTEAIFGEFSPGGKLPVTFPKSVGQIELNFPFKPGSHAGQPGDGPNGFGITNVYGALYPFGHGLSYTTFKYDNLVVTPEKQIIDGNIDVSFTVTNTGKMTADEVVQLYFKDEASSVTVYETQLRGFERITIEPGETQKLNFTLKPNHLKLLDINMKKLVEPGWFQVLIGSSSTDIRLKKRFLMVNSD